MAEYFIGPNRYDAPSLEAGLYVTATPIGNLGDVTIRALATLAAADYILCEDSRVTSRLLERLGIRNTMKPYHEHNAEKVRPAIIAALHEGKSYALVSDAGMPLVSDPGFRLVQACIAEISDGCGGDVKASFKRWRVIAIGANEIFSH